MPGSNLSATTCSSPTNNTVEKVIKNDTVRYVRKGYGIIFASLVFLTYFFIVPPLIKNYVWGKVLDLASPKVLYVVLAYGNHEFMFLVSNLMMWFIYVKKIPFFERYRINPNRKWPWEENKKEWDIMLKKTFKSLFISHFIIIPIMVALDVYSGISIKFSIEDFPTISEIILSIGFFMIVEDFAFYWVHRILHQKSLYPYIHKIHHEYNNPISIASEYAHPFEFLIANLIPSSLGVKLLGAKVHFFTYLMWNTLRIFETIDGHCGYEFSWSPYRLLPLSGSANYHNYHHTHNIGNYGSFFMLWDTFMGTNKSYFQYIAKKEKDVLLNEMRKKFEDEKKIN